jgi:hypothetical protein
MGLPSSSIKKGEILCWILVDRALPDHLPEDEIRSIFRHVVIFKALRLLNIL